jgi:hypothetical protein
LLTLIEPILNPLWVWIFWREVVPPATWVGGGFIIGGLAARYTIFAPPPAGRPRDGDASSPGAQKPS